MLTPLQSDTPAARARVNRFWLVAWAVVPLVALAPFANRAYHIDDPLYLWSAKQIVQDPLDYYGVVVNKWGRDQPLSEIMVIPPGHCYLLALTGRLFGWGEVPMHLTIAACASLLGAGIYLLACRLCARPNLATALALATPAFVISGITIMTDIPMTAFFVWGVYLWIMGLDRDRHTLFAASGVSIAIATLIKYNGFTAVPLLLAYTILVKRRPGWWIVSLLIPVAALAGYQWIEYVLYGRAQVGYSFEYVRNEFAKVLVPDWLRPGIAVTFVGGSMASMAVLAPFLAGRRMQVATVAVAAGLAVAVYSFSETLLYTTRVSPGVTWLLALQAGTWFALGLLLLLIVLADVYRRRNADAVLLALWIMGTLAFVMVVNWSINARALLPLLAPLAIVVVRRIDDRSIAFGRASRWIPACAVAAGASLSLLLAWSDSMQAQIARDAARKFAEDAQNYKYGYHFEAHWGFQYYMEEAGIPYFKEERVQLHDRIVAPLWGSADPRYNPSVARRFSRLEVKRPALSWVSTMHPAVCAGFYAHTRGPLPFAFGPVPPEEFAVFQIENYDR